MAAFSQSRVGSRTSTAVGEQQLPNGSCNYRDLSIGSRAPVCGCARFWLNSSHFSAHDGGSERAWCFCGHHACFHEVFSQQQQEQEQAFAASRMSGVEEQVGGAYNARPSGGSRGSTAGQRPETPSKPPAGLGIHPGSRGPSQHQQSINTRVWLALNEFARNQADGEGSQAESKVPSTTAPSLVEEPRISPSRIIQERPQQYRPREPPTNIASAPTPRPAEEYSATEVATPSVQGTPDFRAFASSSAGQRPSPGHLRPGFVQSEPNPNDHFSRPEMPPMGPPPPVAEQPPAPPPGSTMSPQDVQSIIRAYGHRLEVLESLSFSQVPVEELQERFELFDGRILDLEHWRIDREQAQQAQAEAAADLEPTAASRNKRRRLLPNEASSFASDASFDISAAAHTEAAVLATLAANAETHPRIDALENRVVDLENASMPSYARPWNVQVVLLPWGRELRGIWFSAADATQRSMRSTTQDSDKEWTGAQSGPKLPFKSNTSSGWTTESIQAWADGTQEWLSPKACGPNGTVFQRLASRGLVRDVTLTSPDARHILDAINSTFGQVLEDDGAFEETSEARRYQSLQERYIPLRKVRRSARLRFLSPAEMITSATWTAPFLDSSIFMKVSDGQKRLYLTTPHSYIQSNEDSWNWRKLRRLPLFDASGEEQAAQADNVAIEACWSYNEQLDHANSAHSSFASHGTQWTTGSQFADIDDPEQQPMSPRSDLRLPRQRTVSLPSSTSAAEKDKENLPKRRVASFQPTPTACEAGAEITAKRRRISHSPEAERRGVNFTPRWSREPPSPFTSEAAAEANSRKRGTTPFAYATPHSNSNFVARVDLLGDDGDTEADTDLGERAEEEWGGVEDDDTNLSDGGSVVDDEDEDEEGLTIYEG